MVSDDGSELVVRIVNSGTTDYTNASIVLQGVIAPDTVAVVTLLGNNGSEQVWLLSLPSLTSDSAEHTVGTARDLAHLVHGVLLAHEPDDDPGAVVHCADVQGPGRGIRGPAVVGQLSYSCCFRKLILLRRLFDEEQPTNLNDARPP